MRRLLLCLFLGIVTLLLITLIIDLAENIDTFIDYNAAIYDLALYYIYRTPYWIVLTLPIASLLGSLFALTSLARHNEISAMKSLGIGFVRILTPAIICGILVSLLAFLFTDYIVPESTLRYNRVNERIRSQEPNDGSRRQIFIQGANNQIVFARSYNARLEYAENISIEYFNDGKPIERIVAKRLIWRNPSWIAVDGSNYFFKDQLHTSTSFDTLLLPIIDLQPEDFARQVKLPDEMSYSELKYYIKRAAIRGEDVTRQNVDLQLKVSFPIGCFIIIILGSTLGANAKRGGLANSFGIGVFICFTYYSLIKAGQALGWNHLLDPVIASWLTNFLFALLAVFLLWKAHK